MHLLLILFNQITTSSYNHYFHKEIKEIKVEINGTVLGRNKRDGSINATNRQMNIHRERSCGYWEEFERPKIVYAEISTEGKFLLVPSGYYSDTTTCVIASDSEFLLAVLNSKLFTYILSKTSSEISGGFFRWTRQYMENVPIPSATDAQKAPIIERVRKILADPDSPAVPCLEAEIDHIIYGLYHLTEEEIKLLAGKKEDK